MSRCFPIAIVAALGLAFAAVGNTQEDRAREDTAQKDNPMERLSKPDDPETRNCLSISHIRRIETVDDQTLVFHMRGKDRYVNHLPYRCPGLKRNSFIHETSLNSYCDLDIISVVDLRIGMRMGSCPLGKFQKVTGAPDLD